VLRGVGAVLATAVVGAVVDPARALVAPLPVPLWWRSVLRLLVVLVPAAAVWCAALAWVVQGAGAAVPVGALSVEAAAVLAVGLALAGGLARWRDLDDPGVVAGPAVLCLGLLAWQLPPRVALLVLPGPQWTAAHARWAAVLGAALVVAVLSVRDPARPSLRSSWRARPSPDCPSSCVRG
jgi:hypothetical protein